MDACTNHEGFAVVYDQVRSHDYSCPVCKLADKLMNAQQEIDQLTEAQEGK